MYSKFVPWNLLNLVNVPCCEYDIGCIVVLVGPNANKMRLETGQDTNQLTAILKLLKFFRDLFSGRT